MTLLLAVLTALATPTEEAAAEETAAFAALDDDRDCDAAAAFLRAYALLHDERLLLNAGMAFERAGDTEAARETLSAVEAPAAAEKAQARLRGLGPATVRCPAAAAATTKAPTTTTTTAPATTTTRAPPAPDDPSDTSSTTRSTKVTGATTEDAGVPWLGIGVGALAGGVVVGAVAAGGAALQQSVLFDAGASRGAKDTALSASAPLGAAWVVAAALVIGGGVAVLSSSSPEPAP